MSSGAGFGVSQRQVLELAYRGPREGSWLVLRARLLAGFSAKGAL